MSISSRLLRGFVLVVDRISMIGAGLAALALALIALIMFAEIIVRAVLGISLEFSWEYSTYLMAAMFFLGAAYTLRAGAHIRMGAAIEQFSPRVAAAMDIVATVVGLGAMLLISYALIDLAWQAHMRGSVSFTPMETYIAIPQALPAVGAVILVLQLLARLASRALGLPVETPVAEDNMMVDQ